MTKKQMAYKKALLKKVHLTKTYQLVYKHDRDLWREFLKNNYGVESSKDLSIDELKNLIDVLEKRDEVKVKKATANQLNYLLMEWREKSLYKDYFSLLKLAKKKFKKDFKSLEDLTHKEAGVLIGIVRRMKPQNPINRVDYSPTR